MIPKISFAVTAYLCIHASVLNPEMLWLAVVALLMQRFFMDNHMDAEIKGEYK